MQAEQKGATATEYGFVFGIFELTSFISSPFFGKYVSIFKVHNVTQRLLDRLHNNLICKAISVNLIFVSNFNNFNLFFIGAYFNIFFSLLGCSMVLYLKDRNVENALAIL
jgi:hypothetical protein